jgi:hypothetical protein
VATATAPITSEEAATLFRLEAHVVLRPAEQDKLGATDLFEAVQDLLERKGVNRADCFLEAMRTDPGSRYAQDHTHDSPEP